MEKNLTVWRKFEKQYNLSEKCNMKESQHYNILVLINHHQDLEKMLLSAIR